MKKYSFFFFFLCMGCFDLIQQKEIKIKSDIYALHEAGIDGYSLARRISYGGYEPIMMNCIVSINDDQTSQSMILKRVEKITSTDTQYIKLNFHESNIIVIDTIDPSEFYQMKGDYSKECILLPPK